MSKNEFREVEVWVRGKWKKTKGIVIESDMCTNPDCIRKIPSPRSLAKYRKGITKGYCSIECKASHKTKTRLEVE